MWYMKQFKLLILLLVIGFVAEAQINYLPMNSRYRWIAGKFDSTVTIPYGLTPSIRTGGFTGPASLFFKTSDSTVYVYTGTQWISVKGAGGSADSTIFATLYRVDTAKTNIRTTLNSKIDSLRRSGLNVQAYKNGTWITQFTDSVGSGTGAVTDSLRFANNELSLYQTGGSDLNVHITPSILDIDSTHNPLAGQSNDSTWRLKSLRVQLNGSTVTPTTTDSTLSWNILASGGTTGVKSIEIVGDSAYLVNDSNTFVNANKVYGYQSGTKGWKDTKKMTFTIPYTGEVVMLSGDSLINGRKVDTMYRTLGKDSIIFNIAGTRYAIKDSTGGGGGGSPAGNYGNVQLNRNSALATPASDSLSFTAGSGLNVKGKYLVSGTQVVYLPPSMTATSVYGSGGTSLSHASGNQGYYNTLVGIAAGGAMTTGYMNVGVGWSTLGAGTMTGWENTAIGTGAMYSATNAQQNVAIGKYALFSLTTGLNNIGIGFESLYSNTGSYNIGLGHSAGRLNSSGAENLNIGYFAGYYNQTGSFNTYVGSQAGLGVSTNSNANNVGIGYKNLYAITTGSNNISIGFQAGDALTSGTKNIIIGYDIDAPSNTASNQMTIGNAIFGTGITGTGTTAAGKVGILNNAPDSTFDVTGGMKTSGGVRFTGLPNGGTSSDSLIVATSTGQLKKLNPTMFAQANTESSYTPTLTNTTNIAASTAYETYYIRIGNTIHVWGTVDIDATTASTVCEMGFSLPVSTSLTQIYDVAGTASFEDNTSVQIKADVGNTRAVWRFTPQTATNNKYSFHFTYKYTAP